MSLLLFIMTFKLHPLLVLMLIVLKGLWPRLDCQRDRVAAGRKVPEMHICTKIKRIPSTYKGGGKSNIHILSRKLLFYVLLLKVQI